MKYLILLLTIFLIYSCTNNPKEKQNNLNYHHADKTGAFYINKTNGTFEIYSNKGELVLEFTPQNTDSSSIETLNYIYKTVKEFYNIEYDEENNKQLEDKAI